MKYINTAFLLSIIFLQFISCKDSGTNPTPVIKTPRQMTWTSVTITSPDSTSIQVLPENLVVFSENDMWLVCWSDVARGLLWHYDGKRWTESNIAADVGGMRVNDIAGYSSNDLWTVGYSGDNIFLAHYDGYRWTRQNNMNIKGDLLDMSKDPNGNLWACGDYGNILKFTNKKWNADVIKVNTYADVTYLLKSVEFYKDKTYVLGTVADSKRHRDVYYYITGDISNWTVTDSMIFDNAYSVIKWGNRRLYSSTFGKLYSVGLGGAWVFNNEEWNRIYDSRASLNGIYGINENYLLACGDFQQVLFYNGSNWENIVDLFHLADPNFVFTNVWTNGYETFIIGYGNVGGYTGTIIFHGK